jgi:phage gpG-like protein
VPVFGDKRLIATLGNIRQGLPDVFEDDFYKNQLLTRIKARFMQGVRPDGSPWPNLSPKTIETKKRKGYSRPEQLLYATGALYDAITIISGSNMGTFATNTGLGFRIGIESGDRDMIGRLHNYGFGRLPERRFLGLSPHDVRSYRDVTARRLRKLLRES